ncbi:hypothetical protein AJ80_08019 [Polytolypa hystricis UAMH7299]|uniref:NADH dehydrogenase [ubiquinone] 1 alpha subcomplex subunit 1 n=1 Tax=Polytolypa hystricis (strain UAMH7299) TaxID=1447883 RepID=A0A2B7XEB7_POLH7|nr:hypothetical protein AJ80_08019 [Polytolypa hystricis UAMH7299]
MPVPFEAFLPYGIIIAMFGVTGLGVSTVKYYSNGKKNPRRGIDAWDQQSTYLEPETEARTRKNSTNKPIVMERDMRLTGSLRGQTDNHIAPLGFELNNPWKVSAHSAEQSQFECKLIIGRFIRWKEV